MGKRNIKKKNKVVQRFFLRRSLFQYLWRAFCYPVQNKVMRVYFVFFLLLSFGSLTLQGGILYRVGIDNVVFRTIYFMLPFLVGGIIWGTGLNLITFLQESKDLPKKIYKLSFEDFQEGTGITILAWLVINMMIGESLIIQGILWILILMMGAYFARSRDWDVLWRIWSYGKMFLLNWQYLSGGVISLGIIQLFYMWIDRKVVSYQQLLTSSNNKLYFVLILLIWLWIALGIAYKSLFLINLMGNLQLANKKGKTTPFFTMLKLLAKYIKRQFINFFKTIKWLLFSKIN